MFSLIVGFKCILMWFFTTPVDEITESSVPAQTFEEVLPKHKYKAISLCVDDLIKKKNLFSYSFAIQRSMQAYGHGAGVNTSVSRITIYSSGAKTY